LPPATESTASFTVATTDVKREKEGLFHAYQIRSLALRLCYRYPGPFAWRVCSVREGGGEGDAQYIARRATRAARRLYAACGEVSTGGVACSAYRRIADGA